MGKRKAMDGLKTRLGLLLGLALLISQPWQTSFAADATGLFTGSVETSMTVQRPQTLMARVVDAETGAPIEGAQLAYKAGPMITSASDGLLEFTSPLQGELRARVQCPGYRVTYARLSGSAAGVQTITMRRQQLFAASNVLIDGQVRILAGTPGSAAAIKLAFSVDAKRAQGETVRLMFGELDTSMQTPYPPRLEVNGVLVHTFTRQGQNLVIEVPSNLLSEDGVNVLRLEAASYHPSPLQIAYAPTTIRDIRLQF